MPDALIWPAVVFVLGLFAMLLFRPALEKKIAGITRANKEGFFFERPQEGAEPQPLLLPFEEIIKIPCSPSSLDREKTIEQQLQSFGLKNDAEKISLLSRVLAKTRVELEFNSIANIIFGSQVTLLVHTVGTKNGVARQEAESIFEQAQKTYPDLYGSRKFEEWFSYLNVSNLIVMSGDQFDISQFGKDFLKHLIDSRMAYNRYG